MLLYGVVAAFVVGICVLGFIIAGPFLDKTGLQPAQCRVTSAEGRSADGNRMGTLSAVEFHTSDCGVVMYFDGVTPENREQIASTIEPGEYEFQIGWVSRVVAPCVPNMVPTAQAYRRLDD